MKVFCLDSCLRRNDVSGMTFSSGSLVLERIKSLWTPTHSQYLPLPDYGIEINEVFFQTYASRSICSLRM